MLTILVAGILSLILSSPGFAEEKEFSIYQGTISSVEGLPGYIIVNERQFPLLDDAEIKDSKERHANLSDLKEGKWVYIVSEDSPNGFKAKRIYLLPKYINKNEKDNYPFMKKEEEQKE